jgi:hypothetical protein
MSTERTDESGPGQTAVHTPGPWEAYHVLSAGWSVRMSQPREGFDRPDPICSMAWWQFDKPGIIDNDISGANARLIAAAPELLEALELLWSEVAASGNGTANDFGWKKAREKTLAALEKATSQVV